jgi:uncharacterized protein
MIYLAASIVTLGALLGVLLTLLTFPGIWAMVLVALLCQWWQPTLFSWWTLAAAVMLAGLGELVEFFASAAGAAKAKGSRSAVLASVVGAVVGAVLGTFLLPVPLVGTLVGGVAGAGIAAGLAERGIAHRSWGDSARVARGAATGRALALVAKTGVAIATALVLIVAAFVP